MSDGGMAIGGITGIFDDARQFDLQQRLNREQNSFQDYMSSTAYQRSVEDMKRAGLNPMLAYMKGGADSAQGGSRGMSGVSDSVGKMASAAQISNIMEMNKKLQAETANVQADTKVKEQMVPWYMQSTATSSAEAGRLHSERERIEQERLRLMADMFRIASEGDKVEYYNKHIQPLDKEIRSVELELLKLSLPRARNIAGAQESWWMKDVSPYVPDAAQLGVSAFGIRGMLGRGRSGGITIENNLGSGIRPRR